VAFGAASFYGMVINVILNCALIPKFEAQRAVFPTLLSLIIAAYFSIYLFKK